MGVDHLFHRRVSRRDFIRVGRDVATCVALGSLPAFGGEREPRFRSNPFMLGVASGDPLPNGVVLWTRLDSAALDQAGALTARVPVGWEIAEDDNFRHIVRKGSHLALTELGHSVHAEVYGLRPGRHYWYRFMAGGEISITGRTRTAPAEDTALDQLRFAFVSCQNYENGYFTAYQRIAEEDLDVLVHLGDYIYEATGSPTQSRQHEAGTAFTLDQYRARYSLYRADADLQAAHATCAWIVTPDDHEVSDNYANAISANNDAPAQFFLRRAAAYQTYYEFMPLRRRSMPAGPDMKIFRRLGYGDLAAFHVLDTRQYRSDQACSDGRKPRCAEAVSPAQDMLGQVQEKWLMAGLRGSRTRWNIVANQVMMAEVAQEANGERTYAMDRWDGYVQARGRLMNFLSKPRPSNPIIITGDIHTNWVADLKLDFENPSSAVVGTEFVGTSISSSGDGDDSTRADVLALNPHIKFFNNRRGYVRCTLTPSTMTTDYRTLPYVSRPGAPVETRATFVVENGRPGAQLVSSGAVIASEAKQSGK